MKKALIEVKRLNSNDTIATSTKICNHVANEDDYLFKSNGTSTFDPPGTIFFETSENYYQLESGSFVSKNPETIYGYYSSNVNVKNGKWYHLKFAFDAADFELVECPNPESHSYSLD